MRPGTAVRSVGWDGGVVSGRCAARDQGSDVTADRGQGRVEGVTRAGGGGIVAVARDIRGGDRRTADRVDVCLGGFRVDAVTARFPGQQPGERTARSWGGVVGC